MGIIKRRIFLCIFLALFFMPSVVRVSAWSNGGFSPDPAHPDYGTHDWIAHHALDWLPTKEKSYIVDNLASYLYGTELPDNGQASDGIGDTGLHHVYYRSSGALTDDAGAVRASTVFGEVVNYLKFGDSVKAAKYAGIMGHYIVDLAVFGHVMGSDTDWGAEKHHSDYETYVNQRTSSYDAEFNVFFSFDGNLTIISAYNATIHLAYDTTFDLDGDLTCLWMDQNYNWSNPAFRNRCGESLNLAVNLLADVLHTLYVEATVPTPKELALEHLREIMDKYHSDFDVYTDLSSAGNHFVKPAQMGQYVEMNLSSFENPHSGATCIENKFYGTGTSWGGWYLMNGVLEGEETQPKPNWGEYPEAGFNLTGATKLTFWARGKEGGERVEFFAFGVGRDPDTGKPIAPYPDSSRKRSLGYITLSNEWKQYTIDLSGVNLSYVLGGFGWVTNAPQNNNRQITFYLDDIKYDKERLDEPRFLVSYELLPSDIPVLKNTAFTYDNALALLAFLASQKEQDLKRAKLIGDAFIYAMEHDRYFTDGRLRNAYQGGDLRLFPGWKPHGKADTVRMPGWWNTTSNMWLEDKYCVSTHTGSVAWSIIALLSLYKEAHDDNYLNASIRLNEWIENECRDARGSGGYTGGYEGWEKTANNPQGQTKILWKSTEHNIDVYVAFSRGYESTGDSAWKERSLYAKHFVKTMWDEEEGHFWTGTVEDGITINKENIPMDIHAWSLMAIDEVDEYERGINWVESNCYVEADGFMGFDFNNDRDGIWFEGTAHMVVAYQILRKETKTNLYLNELRRAQKEASNTNGKGLVAASHDGVSTGFEWKYDARLHIGATAWLIFAEAEYNPYWSIKTSEPLPDNIPPVTVNDYVDAWHVADFTINLTATDYESGVAETYYQINGGSIQNVRTYGQPRIITESANNTLEYWSVDYAGNEELPHKILTGIKLDKTAPMGSIAINSNATYATSTSVTLTLTATDATSGVYQVRFSNDGVWDTEPWENPSPTKIWTLTLGDGTKTVYYQIRDKAGLISITYSDTIILDTTPPTGSITVVGGATYTNSSSVTLTLSAEDDTSGVAQMRFSNDNVTWTPWEVYSTSKTWALMIGDGTKTVYVQFRDKAGLTSPTYQDTIILDTTKPVANAGQDKKVNVDETVVFDAGASTDNSAIVSYEWEFGDGTKGTGKTTSHAYTKPGTYTVTLTVKDAAGNTANHSITVTIVEPFPTWMAGAVIAAIAAIIGAVFAMRKRKPKA